MENIIRHKAPIPKSTSNQNGIIRSFVAPGSNYLLLKRCFDIIFSLLVIVVFLSWLIPLIALLIKAESKGPVFFTQKRVGKTGKLFRCIKFRSMILNGEAHEKPAIENDVRITRIGKFLRSTNLDEFPQFINVLLGQMSIVGPRPHMPVDCRRFSFVVPSYSFRNLVKPGVTGWAQVNGFHGPIGKYENIMLRYYWDARYIRKANFRLDLLILLQTIRKFFVGIFFALTKNKNSRY